MYTYNAFVDKYAIFFAILLSSHTLKSFACKNCTLSLFCLWVELIESMKCIYSNEYHEIIIYLIDWIIVGVDSRINMSWVGSVWLDFHLSWVEWIRFGVKWIWVGRELPHLLCIPAAALLSRLGLVLGDTGCDYQLLVNYFMRKLE